MMTSELRWAAALSRTAVQHCTRSKQSPAKMALSRMALANHACASRHLHTLSQGPSSTSGSGSLSDIHLWLHSVQNSTATVVPAPAAATTPLQQYLDTHDSSLVEMSEHQYVYHRVVDELDISVVAQYEQAHATFTIVVVNTQSHETLTLRVNPANQVAGAAAKRQILIGTTPAYQLSSLAVRHASSGHQEQAVSLSSIDKPSLTSFLQDTVGFDQQLLEAVNWHRTELKHQWQQQQTSQFVQSPFRYI